MSDEPTGHEPWWHTFFDQTYAGIGLTDTDPERTAKTAKTVDFLLDVLKLDEGMCVFDQCCGTGRLSLLIAGRGVHVVGVEQAAAYVEQARREERDLTLKAREESRGAVETARAEMERRGSEVREKLEREVEGFAGSVAARVLGRSL